MAVLAHSADELIEDREIDSRESDRLAHADIVEQLHVLVKSVPTPSNIALYGAWGSGKSGIGKMLEASLKRDKAIKFARFDAFKYAQNPLRRNFISVVANAVDIKDDKYHRDLYSGLVNTDFKMPPAKVWHLLRMFGFIAALCLVIVLLVVSGITFLQGGDFIAASSAVLVSAVPASLVPAVLLTALISLAGKTFVEERRADRAESDEEFENLFSDLVRATKAKRLVIFVDELDRCAPDDVVGTLDSVRTFFGVEGCVFIVASDPHVLEQALTSGSKQANPVDSANPYYSAGSAYLDKVFQYQVALPPLMPQSVTSFAIELVLERSGVWQEIDVPVVASILVPAHVRSPRRVKNLLNSFVLAYRLAEARKRSGLLEVDIANYVEELARIVCLRVEFPLFARDLIADPELSTYVLELSALEEKDYDSYWADQHPASEQTKLVAQAYSRRTRAVDRLLVDGDDSEQSADAVKEVQEAHGQQLLDYLSRTRMVIGPTKALIHLQNSGQLFGLPAALADQLEREAQNGNIPAIRSMIADMDNAKHAAALDLLTQLARTAPGYEGWNIAQAILAFLSDRVPAERAEPVVAVVGPIIDQRAAILTEETIVGAWNLALASKRAEAKTLGCQVLASEFAAGETMVVNTIMSAEKAKAFGVARLSEILVSSLLGRDPSSAIQALAKADNSNRLAALRAVDTNLTKRLLEALEAHAVWQKAEEVRSATPVPTAGVRRAAAVAASDDQELSEEEPYDAQELLGMLVDLVVAIKPLDPTSAELMLSILLDLRRAESREAIQASASKLNDVANGRRSVASALREIAVRHHFFWPGLLNILDSNSVPTVATAGDALVKLVGRLGSKTVDWENESADGSARACATALMRITEKYGDETRARISSAAAMLGSAVASEADIAKHLRSVDVAMILADEGLCLVLDVQESESRALVETLETELEPEAINSQLAQYVVEGIERVLTVASGGAGSQLSANAQSDLFAALAGCDWLSETDRSCARAVAFALADPEANKHGLAMPDSTEIDATKGELGADQYTWLVQHWLQATDEELANIITVIRPLLTARPLFEVVAALDSWRERAGTVERFELVDQLIGHRGTVPATKPVFNAIGLHELPDDEASVILLKRYRAATTNSHRLEVLLVWEAADIRNATVRAALISDLMIPLLGCGVTAAGPALKYVKALVTPVPPSVKKALGDALITASEGRDFEKRAINVLEEAGYKPATKGWFGRKKTIDTAA